MVILSLGHLAKFHVMVAEGEVTIQFPAPLSSLAPKQLRLIIGGSYDHTDTRTV